jgi:hypothetical protein
MLDFNGGCRYRGKPLDGAIANGHVGCSDVMPKLILPGITQKKAIKIGISGAKPGAVVGRAKRTDFNHS